jgi:hypothetical protein
MRRGDEMRAACRRSNAPQVPEIPSARSPVRRRVATDPGSRPTTHRASAFPSRASQPAEEQQSLGSCHRARGRWCSRSSRARSSRSRCSQRCACAALARAWPAWSWSISRARGQGRPGADIPGPGLPGWTCVVAPAAPCGRERARGATGGRPPARTRLGGPAAFAGAAAPRGARDASGGRRAPRPKGPERSAGPPRCRSGPAGPAKRARALRRDAAAPWLRAARLARAPSLRWPAERGWSAAWQVPPESNGAGPCGPAPGSLRGTVR